MSTLSLTPSTRLLSLAYCMYSLKPSVTGAKATAGVPDSGWYEPTLSSPSIGALAASGSAQSSVLAFPASAGASLADGAVTSAVLSGASVSDGGVVSATLDAVVTAPPPVVVADDSLLSSLPHAASSRTPTAVRAARCLPLRIIGFFSPLGSALGHRRRYLLVELGWCRGRTSQRARCDNRHFTRLLLDESHQPERSDEHEGDDQRTQEEGGDPRFAERAGQPVPLRCVDFQEVVDEVVSEGADDRSEEGRCSTEEQREQIFDRGEDREGVLVHRAEPTCREPARHAGERRGDPEGDRLGHPQVHAHHRRRGLVVTDGDERASDPALAEVAYHDIRDEQQHEGDPVQIERAPLAVVVDARP